MSTLKWGRGHTPHARIPQWILFSDISDRAVRLYCILARYADETGKAFPSKPRLMKQMHGVSRSTLDRAISELVSINALHVIRQTRDDGGYTANDYVLHWAEEVVISDESTSHPWEEGTSHQPEGQEERMPEGTSTSLADAREAGVAQLSPPPLVKSEGRNPAFDALAAVCGIQDRSPRFAQVAAAINGRKGTSNKLLEEGITHLFFHQCVEWIEQQTPRDRDGHYKTLLDPERYGIALAKAIEQKARMYRAELPGATLTPTALRNWWLDLKGRPTDDGLSSDDIRRFGS